MISNIDINKIVISNRFLFDNKDFKYFIGYKEIRLLCLFFPEINIYKRYFDETKCMYFIILYFFDKYMTIWEKVTDIMLKEI